MKLAVVIPMYNEASRLDVKYIVSNSNEVTQWIFVDDGSTDQTPQIIRQLVTDIRAKGGSAESIELPENSGKGEAVRQGILMAAETDCDICGFLDSDFSTPLSEFTRIAHLADSGDSPIVLGARVALIGKDIRRTPGRHYMGRVAATLISALLDLPVYDTQAGIKVFRREVVKDLFEEPFISRWLFDCEFLLRAKKAGLSMVEEPLDVWHENFKGNKVNIGSYFRSLLDLVKIYRSM